MGFTRSITDIKVHQKLGDYPNQDNGLTAEELKKKFDYPSETLQNDLNKLEEELESVVGAANIGALPLDDNDDSNNNVQAKLEYIHKEAQEATLGQIPDGTITESKLATSFSNFIAKKNDELQVGLNSEKINGKTYSELQEEMANQKALYIEDEFTFRIMKKSHEILTKEYELDDTRMILMTFVGATSDGEIKCSISFDCGTNTIIDLLQKETSLNSNSLFMKNAENLDYNYFTKSGSYRLDLNSIKYNKETHKLTIEYIKVTGLDESETSDSYLKTNIYGISGKI